MLLRPRLALSFLALTALLLAGCAPSAAVDQTAAQEWRTAQEESLDGRTDVLGTMSGTTSTTAEDGSTLSFDTPVEVTAFEVACFGGGTAQFGYALSGEGVGVSAELPVACTAEPEIIEVGLDGAASIADVSTVETRATRSDAATTFVVAVVGTAP
ncbi:hypothetical protein [Microbacterium sp. 2FI]|uniref:hypothetical protein n=1 Tax=Microbacterium sp. 2FI TaxID=2502193 RepID=UPI0010F48411|nr:hypothetical protein [Microbacterium sp. 2FI]